MQIDLSAYDFVDFGCSHGGSLAFGKAQLGGHRGLGLDRDPTRVEAARAAGFDAEVADFTSLDLGFIGTARFVTISHLIEHLPGRDVARSCIQSACRIADEFVFIRQPYFDADGYLFSLRLKLYWSDFTVHPYHMTSLELHSVLTRLLEEHRVSRFLLFFRTRIEASHHSAIHPIWSPPDQHGWEPSVHGAKPVHELLFPVFRETGAIVLTGSQSINDEILKFLQSCTIVFDSDDPVVSREAEALSSITKLSERPDLEGVLAEHKKVKSDLEALVNSFSFRLGQMLVQAVRWPGRNTVLLPYRLAQLCLGEFKKPKRPGQVSHRQQLGKDILCRKGDCVARSSQAQTDEPDMRSCGTQEDATVDSFLPRPVTAPNISKAMSAVTELLSLDHYGVAWDDGERTIPELWELHPLRRATRFGLLSLYEFATRFAEGKRVLDFGCGVGYGSCYLLSRGAKAVTAIDIDPASIRYAIDRYRHPDLEFIETSVEALSENESYIGAYDVVYCSNVMEHIPDFRSALTAVTRLLAPNGLYMQVTPPSGQARGNPWHVTNLTVPQWIGILSEFFSVQACFAHVLTRPRERVENQFDFRFVQCAAEEMAKLQSISGVIICRR